jgi:hypothetical protein
VMLTRKFLKSYAGYGKQLRNKAADFDDLCLLLLNVFMKFYVD